MTLLAALTHGHEVSAGSLGKVTLGSDAHGGLVQRPLLAVVQVLGLDHLEVGFVTAQLVTTLAPLAVNGTKPLKLDLFHPDLALDLLGL